MNHYEITFISREEAEKDAVKKLIESFDGKIEQITTLGEKTFAYPIKKENRGFYTTFLFTLEPDKLIEITKKLNLKEEVIRFLIISVKPAQIKARAEKELTHEITPATPKEETTMETAVKTETKSEEPAEEVKVKEEAEVKEIKEVKKEKAEIKEKSKKIIKKAEKTEKKEKPVKAKEEPKPKKETAKKTEVEEPVDEEERLKALDKKLEELLKD